MVEGGSNHLNDTPPPNPTFSVLILERMFANHRTAEWKQRSFYDLDPENWRYQTPCFYIPRDDLDPSEWKYPAPFIHAPKPGFKIKPSVEINADLKMIKENMREKQIIVNAENQRKGAVRKQGVKLIQENINCGRDLSETRTHYIENAEDIVYSKPYEVYLDYAHSKNLEPMTLPQWAKLRAQETFVSDLTTKLLRGSTFRSPK